jgi:hypothetical protein
MKELQILFATIYCRLFYRIVKINKNILHICIVNNYIPNPYSDLVYMYEDSEMGDLIFHQELSEQTSLYIFNNFKYRRRIFSCLFSTQKFKVDVEHLIELHFENFIATPYLEKYLSNNYKLFSDEEIIKLLAYDLKIYQLIKQPSQEVKDFYELLSI